MPITFRTQTVKDVEVFYREAGVTRMAYCRDLPDAEVTLLDAGHFALETHAAEIGAAMRRFLAANLSDRRTQ